MPRAAQRPSAFLLMMLLMGLIGCSEEPTQSAQQADLSPPISLLEQVQQGLPEPSEASGIGRPITGEPLSVDGLTFYADRSTFDATFPSLPVEDFEEANVGEGGIVPCPHPLDENSNNDCFSPGDILHGMNVMASHDRGGLELAAMGQNFFLNPSKNVAATVFSDALILNFPNSGVTAVGLDLHVYFAEEIFQIDIFGESGLLASTQALASSAGRFWGVSSNEVITQIVILSPTNQAEAVDNVAFNAGAGGPTGLIEVEVDIKPGSDLNPIKIGAKGKIPVAILTTEDFDVADVDLHTVTLGDSDGNDTPIATKRNGTLFASMEDVDADDDMDLILHFLQADLEANGDLDIETAELILNGMSLDGASIQGRDSVFVR